MKTQHFFLFLLVMLAIDVNAQDWSGATYKFWLKYPGYIVTEKGDTVRGYIEHQDRIGNQNHCIFFADPNDKKTKKKYAPHDLKGYMVGDKVYKSAKYSGGLVASQKFNLIVKNGQIHRITFYTKEEGYIVEVRKLGEDDYAYDKRICQEQMVWQKGDENPFQHTSFVLKFAHRMSELVSDDTELSKKVADKQDGYGLGHVFSIIDEYNTWYDDTHKTK